MVWERGSHLKQWLGLAFLSGEGQLHWDCCNYFHPSPGANYTNSVLQSSSFVAVYDFFFATRKHTHKKKLHQISFSCFCLWFSFIDVGLLASLKFPQLLFLFGNSTSSLHLADGSAFNSHGYLSLRRLPLKIMHWRTEQRPVLDLHLWTFVYLVFKCMFFSCAVTDVLWEVREIHNRTFLLWQPAMKNHFSASKHYWHCLLFAIHFCVKQHNTQ